MYHEAALSRLAAAWLHPQLLNESSNVVWLVGCSTLCASANSLPNCLQPALTVATGRNMAALNLCPTCRYCLLNQQCWCDVCRSHHLLLIPGGCDKSRHHLGHLLGCSTVALAQCSSVPHQMPSIAVMARSHIEICLPKTLGNREASVHKMRCKRIWTLNQLRKQENTLFRSFAPILTSNPRL
jgi:hypothetical protein